MLTFTEWTAVNKQYYHGSKQSFPIGFVLSPRKGGYVSQEWRIEKVIEKFRPINKLKRANSVFLVDDPKLIEKAGGYDDYVYQVEPQLPVEASDMYWYSQLSIYQYDITENEKKLWATNYWNGVPAPEGKYSLMEYRSSSAKILTLLSK